MMFGIDSLYIWLAVIIISVAVEAFTLTLCGIWFAAGGVAALIAASLSVGLMGQWIVFIVFSALLLVLVRPLCRRFLGSRQQATNADRIIGQIAVVTEPIDNVLETGAVKINGNCNRDKSHGCGDPRRQGDCKTEPTVKERYHGLYYCTHHLDCADCSAHRVHCKQYRDRAAGEGVCYRASRYLP